MSSVRNDSMQFLRGWYEFQKKFQKRFKAQQTRLLQRPDQTGVLTAEQQDLNKRLKAVSDDFMATAKRMEELKSLTDDYDKAQQNNELTLIHWIEDRVNNDMQQKFQNLTDKVKELEKIKKE